MSEQSLEAIQYYEGHPVEFCKDLIDGVDFDDWQIEAFDALYRDHFVAIKAGSGVGKTVWLALAMLHFLATKPFSKVPCTAPSQHQLNDLLWGEANKWISRSAYLKELLHWTQTKITVRGYDPQWFAVARTARVSPSGKVAEGLQGFHAEENLLYIIDEASGVPEEIFPAVEGALTGKNAYAILAANPTRLTGYFHSIFTDLRMRAMYKLMTVSCLDSKFVEERYLTMMRSRYGENHPIWQIKVLGDFPTADVSILFPPEDVETFRNQDPIDMRGARFAVEGGLDVGRTKNKSIVCFRKGHVILRFDTCALTGGISDTPKITNWAVELINAYNPESFKVDCIGIGAGVYDNLKKLFPRVVYPVIGNAMPEAEKKQRYANLRAQGYWELRELLPTIYCKDIPIEIINSMGEIQYKLRNGKILIQSKDDMTDSPDELDALMYAFLNADLCVDIAGQYMEVFGLGNMNAQLEKTSQWDKIGKIDNGTGLSRFSPLYH